MLIVWYEKLCLMKHSSILNFIWMVFLSHIGQTENVMVGVLWFLLWFPECCWRFVCWTKFFKKKSKWLLFDTYHPSAQNDQYLFNYADKAFDTYSNYDNVLLAEYFNAEDDGPSLRTFSINMISITLSRWVLVLKIPLNQHPLISL